LDRLRVEGKAGACPPTIRIPLPGDFSLASAKEVYRCILQAAARVGQPLVMGALPDGPQVAILTVPPIMDPGRFTQAVANNRGVRMRSESLQELLSWLGV
jgi:hypothetical protein